MYSGRRAGGGFLAKYLWKNKKLFLVEIAKVNSLKMFCCVNPVFNSTTKTKTNTLVLAEPASSYLKRVTLPQAFIITGKTRLPRLGKDSLWPGKKCH